MLTDRPCGYLEDRFPEPELIPKDAKKPSQAV